MIDSMMAAALGYAKKGKPVFPCAPGKKTPLTAHGFKDATTDEARIRQWWTEHPRAWIALPTGAPSGIVVLDIDIKNGAKGAESLAALETQHGKLPKTKRQRTQSGGWHYLFKNPLDVELKNSTSKLGDGIDVRANGGYVILAPSEGYKWETGKDTPLADLPQWGIDLLTSKPKPAPKPPKKPPERRGDAPAAKYWQTAYDGELDKMRDAAEGTRNGILNGVAFRMAQMVSGEESGNFITESMAHETIAAAVSAGLSEAEAKKTFASGFQAGLQSPATKPERPEYRRQSDYDYNDGDGGEAQPHGKAQEPLRNGEYRMNKSGLVKGVANAEGEVAGVPVTFTSFQVLGLARGIDQGGWGIVLSWLDRDGAEHIETIQFRLLSGDAKELAALFTSGGGLLAPSPKAPRQLTEYLAGLLPGEQRRLRIVDACGWQQGDSFTLPDGGVIGQTNSERIIFDAPDGCKVGTAGSYEAWRDGVADYAQGNPLLAFALGCAFAPPLLHLLGIESGGFHFWGSSSTGKSTVIRAAWGVWGDPAVLSSWRTTANGIEARAASTNDFLLVLDDSKQADAATIERIIYLLGNQAGKGRMAKTLTLAWTMTFRNFVLSTGESDFQFELERRKLPCDGGLDVRLAGINAERWTYGAFNDLHGMASGADFAESIKIAACANYGHAGRHFLEKLCNELQHDRNGFIDGLRARHADWIESFCPAGCDGQVRRVASRFALVGVAAGLAVEWDILEAGTELAAPEIFQAWLRDRGGAGSHEAASIIENVKNFIRHESQKYLIAPSDEAPRPYKTYGLRVTREHCESGCVCCRCEVPDIGGGGVCLICGKPPQTDCPNGGRCKYYDYWLAGKKALQRASDRPAAQAKKAIIAAGIMEPTQRKWTKGGRFHAGWFYVIPGDRLIDGGENG